MGAHCSTNGPGKELVGKSFLCEVEFPGIS
jgi:hypothetical protein